MHPPPTSPRRAIPRPLRPASARSSNALCLDDTSRPPTAKAGRAYVVGPATARSRGRCAARIAPIRSSRPLGGRGACACMRRRCWRRPGVWKTFPERGVSRLLQCARWRGRTTLRAASLRGAQHQPSCTMPTPAITSKNRGAERSGESGGRAAYRAGVLEGGAAGRNGRDAGTQRGT